MKASVPILTAQLWGLTGRVHLLGGRAVGQTPMFKAMQVDIEFISSKKLSRLQYK